MLTDIKLSKVQLSKTILLGGFLGNIIGNLAEKAPINVAIPFVKYALAKLVSNIASNAA